MAGSEDRGEYDRDGLHVDAVVRGHGELVGDVNVDVVTVDKGQDGLHQEWTRWVTSDEFTNKLKQFFIVVRCCSLDRSWFHHQSEYLQSSRVNLRTRMTDQRK